MWRQKTNKGRVVYERKIHKFGWCDAARIIRNLNNEDLTWSENDRKCLLEVHFRVIRGWAASGMSMAEMVELDTFGLYDQLVRFNRFYGYSGGRFGGSGATRDYD